MRKKIKLIILLISIIVASIFLSNKSFAANGYTIENYDIDMKVNEDNTFDITETITTNFSISKHGIYRKIPLKNTIRRLDRNKLKEQGKDFKYFSKCKV